MAGRSVAAVKTVRKKKFLIAMEKAGSWYPITVNGLMIVNRATLALTQETIDKIKAIKPNGHIQIFRNLDDQRYEVWLAVDHSVNSKRDMKVEVYLTRYYAERFARKVATALEVPCVSLLPVWDFAEEERKRQARSKK